MAHLGYDPDALVSFFAKLRAHQTLEAKLAGRDVKEVDQNNILATHPRTADRIQQAIDLADKNGDSAARRAADIYLDAIDGLVFGDDPAQGIVRGPVFTHPGLNLRFEVPEGFTIKNLPDLVMATEESGAIIKFAGADAVAVREAGGMKNYLLHTWDNTLNLDNVEWLDINGMKAVTGTIKVRVGVEKAAVRRILIEQDTDTYWRFQFETPAKEASRLNEPLRRTTYSLRAPTRAELAAAEPYRVRVIQVGPGVSVENLIDAMAVPKMKAEWFEALNGLKPGDVLTPGQKIKVIK